MTVEKLRRVLWRVRKNTPKGQHPTYHTLKKAITQECGVWPETYKHNMEALIRLRWVIRRREYVELTNKDLTEE